MTESIGNLVRKAEDQYNTGNTVISDYVTFNLKENVNKIDAYYFSKHTSGSTDSLNREKPFFNIVKAAVNIWYRATNIARNKIRIKATKKAHKVIAFIGTILLQEWMKKTGFEQFLDEWGRTLAKYGSALTKFVEKDGQLVATVEPWNRLICDAIQFEGNMSVVKLELTPAQLRKEKNYNQDQVKALLNAKQTRKTLGGEQKDNKDEYITLYEVHGEFNQEQYNKAKGIEVREGDDEIFFQQMHVLSYVEGDSNKNEKEYEDFYLFSGKEKDPYLMTHLIKEDGRVEAVGAIEDLFDAQWMVNHSAKLIKDQLDLAGQMIFQTNDGAYVGKNVLQDIVNGDILIYSEEKNPLTQLANNAHDITALQNFSASWQNLAKDITSTPDAVRGATAPSGTAFRTVAVENKEGKSLFEVMTRNKKRALEEMLRRFVIPSFKKWMDTSEEVASILEFQDITRLDALYVPNEAIKRNNRQIIDTVLTGQVAQMPDQMMMEQQIRDELSQDGNQRFFKPSDIPSKTWKEVLKDLQWEVEIDIQDKETDEMLVLQYLIDWFKVAANPQMQAYLQTPQGKLVSSKILEKSNAISPIELASLPEPKAMQPVVGASTAQPELRTIQQ